MLTELARREPLFHQPLTRADFLRQTADDFSETGASGQVYDREFVWSVLAERFASGEPDETGPATDLQVRELAVDTYLVTYALTQGVRRTRRATVWQRRGADWVALYHQGTVVA
ncbi:DUF4440 domain-containing protein [Gordonia sp. X0973]|uniref:nuclear transport factor 2 family protein n=1 Tax=Gordonia sp. X0973 TaxID=2742602 RepID=UPI000F541208|nr:DUF4440 domain-containing protein [Gordonia sp. X0973]QKT06616.1 DUF4440 domain-containing protein [Gordonia sp. X0973]